MKQIFRVSWRDYKQPSYTSNFHQSFSPEISREVFEIQKLPGSGKFERNLLLKSKDIFLWLTIY